VKGADDVPCVSVAEAIAVVAVGGAGFTVIWNVLLAVAPLTSVTVTV
jgi:hypothetical protein